MAKKEKRSFTGDTQAHNWAKKKYKIKREIEWKKSEIPISNN